MTIGQVLHELLDRVGGLSDANLADAHDAIDAHFDPDQAAAKASEKAEAAEAARQARIAEIKAELAELAELDSPGDTPPGPEPAGG